MSIADEPAIVMARALRKAIRERTAYVSAALELFGEAYTPLERKETADFFLETVGIADGVYEARVELANAEFQRAERAA